MGQRTPCMSTLGYGRVRPTSSAALCLCALTLCLLLVLPAQASSNAGRAATPPVSSLPVNAGSCLASLPANCREDPKQGIKDQLTIGSGVDTISAEGLVVQNEKKSGVSPTACSSQDGLSSGLGEGVNQRLVVGLESGLMKEAHPGFGRVAAAAVLGFDRLKRPMKPPDQHSQNELLEAARKGLSPDPDLETKPQTLLEKKSREVERNMSESVPQDLEALDKFAADEKRAADVARYKKLIKAAVHAMDSMNDRLWSWGSISRQLGEVHRDQNGNATMSSAGETLDKHSAERLDAGLVTELDKIVVPKQRLGGEIDTDSFDELRSGQVNSEFTRTACAADCSDHGRCISRRCICSVGYGGNDCSKPQGFDSAFRSFADMGAESAERKLQVCFVTNEVAGPITNGGIGTAFTTMAYSLAERGHQVTILFTMGEVSMRGSFAEWVVHYARAGITLLGLQRPPQGTHHVARALIESNEVLRFLRERTFDVVHFPDYQGAGYYSVLAKKQGLSLNGTALVVGVHGPSFWAKKAGNGEPITAVRSLEGNFMEHRTVALADFVVAPSQYILRWMEREGWQLPPSRTFVQPNLLPKSDWSQESARGMRDRAPVSELVFFGRLETRKGVVTFCDAVDEILGVAKNGETSRLEDQPSGFINELSGAEDRSEPPTSGISSVDVHRVKQIAGLQQDAEASETFRHSVGEGGDAPADVEVKLGRVIFLGRSAFVEGEWGVEYVQRRAGAWGGLPWKIVTRMDPLEAKEYLRGEGRLAVMPSKVENSPYTVYECAELGIPFIAADVGGISDLIHPADRQHALFEPTLQGLVSRLSRALSEGVRPARPAVDAAANEDAWMTWHADIARETRAADGEKWACLEETLAGKDRPFVTVVITHYNRPSLCKQAIESLESQDYPAESLEVVLVDDGSTQEEALTFLDEIEPEFERRGWRVLRQANAYLGAARNAGARIAKGKYILFMDDDNWAKPHEVSTYVRAMEWGGADVMTSFVDFFWSADARPPHEKDRPSYLFLGGSSDVGAFKNCFGDANCFVRKECFFEIGGYTEDYGIGYEDWELYANATLRGFQVDVLPDPVYWYRFNPGSMQKTTDYFVNRRRALRPYLSLIPEREHEALLAAVFPRRENHTTANDTRGDSTVA